MKDKLFSYPLLENFILDKTNINYAIYGTENSIYSKVLGVNGGKYSGK